MVVHKSGKSGSGRRQSATGASSTASAKARKSDGKASAVRFGHRFKKPELLTRALTHSSAGGADNERLEFLGDRVLGLIISELLIDQFPNEKEGLLALKLNALVRDLTGVWQASQGDLPQVYRVLVTHPALAETLRQKVRQPFDYLVACYRALGITGERIAA